MRNRKTPFVHPVPIVLVGAKVESRANYTTVGDVAIAGLNPPLIMISLHEKHYTTRGIEQTGWFSVNTPSTEMLSKVDYCGIVSGREVNKEKVISTNYSEQGVPYAEDAYFSLICKVVHRVQIEHRVIYIGKVEEDLYHTDVLIDGEVSLEKTSPILYGLNNHYYKLGQPIGKGYHEGKTYFNKK